MNSDGLLDGVAQSASLCPLDQKEEQKETIETTTQRGYDKFYALIRRQFEDFMERLTHDSQFYVEEIIGKA